MAALALRLRRLLGHLLGLPRGLWQGPLLLGLLLPEPLLELLREPLRGLLHDRLLGLHRPRRVERPRDLRRPANFAVISRTPWSGRLSSPKSSAVTLGTWTISTISCRKCSAVTSRMSSQDPSRASLRISTISMLKA